MCTSTITPPYDALSSSLSLPSDAPSWIKIGMPLICSGYSQAVHTRWVCRYGVGMTSLQDAIEAALNAALQCH
jgi:hypothetical protein